MGVRHARRARHRGGRVEPRGPRRELDDPRVLRPGARHRGSQLTSVRDQGRTPMLLADKHILVTGVLTPSSIAWATARIAQEQGADIVLTSFGRAKRLAERSAKKLPHPPDVLDLDVTSEADLEALREQLSTRWGTVDGVLHSIAFAPASCMGGNFMTAEWTDVQTALHVSAFSLKALARALAPLMPRGSAI